MYTSREFPENGRWNNFIRSSRREQSGNRATNARDQLFSLMYQLPTAFQASGEFFREQAGENREKIEKILLYNLSCMVILSGMGASVCRRSRPVEKPVEESPDCEEQGVLLKRRIPRTISRGKASATERIPPPVRRRQGKRRRTGKPLLQQDQIGDEPLLAAFGVPGSGRTDR